MGFRKLRPRSFFSGMGSLGKGQKPFIFLVQGVTGPGNGTDEQFQLVVSRITELQAHAPNKRGSNASCTFEAGVVRHAQHHVEVRVHEHFAFTR